ncbi:MAG: S46 family peptidase, partial [Gemmataceae bacterium]|nr:S46 family peptidase [Gemmataceae bacterium]
MRTLTVAALAACLALPARAGEGMWLYNALPLDKLKKDHEFEPTKEWLEKLQKSSVRVGQSGSASFVSADGLVITNHHVASDALQKLGTKEKNYYRDGYHAKSRDEELKCEAMELNVLMEIKDVTEEVQKAVPDGAKAEEATAKRRAIISRIEEKAKKETKLQPQVVTLFQGGAYHLYLYKKYTDVRLVFAPEMAIAFFGGDPDNFEFPRFDLDITFFRVYEDGKPAKVPHHLTFATESVKDGDLTFVSGHPGRTRRMNTVADLEFMRDVEYPYMMKRLNRLEVLLSTYSDRNEENKRQAKDILFSVQNSRKARIGGLKALLDPALMKEKAAQEKRLKAAATEEQRGAWDKIAKAQEACAKLMLRHSALERGAAFFSDYFGQARTLARAAAERAKDNKDRLPEYGEARLESLTEQLFSKEPVYDQFEITKLADSLTWLAGEFGYKDELVQKVLAGKSPLDRASELVNGYTLKKAEDRKRVYDGGKLALADASKDPMIALAELVDEEARAVRKRMETEVEEPLKQGYDVVAKIKGALDKDSTYPDATFTLRLSYGVVKGYEEGGKKVPHATTFKGLYERSAEFKNRDPFELPESWAKAKAKLDLDTPFNFVHTNDIIGGNSGSPVVNRKG